VAAVSRNLSSHDLRHDAATRSWKEYKDVALLQQFLGDRDIKSAMRYVNIGGKEASRLMRACKMG
jgi:integrase